MFGTKFLFISVMLLSSSCSQEGAIDPTNGLASVEQSADTPTHEQLLKSDSRERGRMGAADMSAPEGTQSDEGHLAEIQEWLDNWEREQVAQSRSQSELQREQSHDKSELTALSTVEVERLNEIADQLHAKWSDRDPTFHAQMMLEVVQRVENDTQLAEMEVVGLREKYVGFGLRNLEVVPLRLAVQLVEQLRFRSVDAVRALSAEDWSERRREQLRHWFHVYRRIHEAVEPKWRETLIKNLEEFVEDEDARLRIRKRLADSRAQLRWEWENRTFR
jgi:hypothetical protein